MNRYIIPSVTLEDYDDMFLAAIEQVACEHDLDAYDLTASWGDEYGTPDDGDISRETIIVKFEGV